jgi:nucleoid DNA-binding protein
MTTLNKSQLVDAVSNDVDATKKLVGEVLDSVLEHVVKSLKGGSDVALKNFCTFKVKDRKARAGVNPKTGEKINIPACRVPGVSFSKHVKDSVKS